MSEAASARVAGCELCERESSPAWRLVHRDDRLRVIRVLDSPDFPAFYRVVWNAHAGEMSDLSSDDAARCMAAVTATERALRALVHPTKINLAALGNMVPHLHWHVIARFDWDSHFPQSIWGSAQRASDEARLVALRELLPEVDAAVATAVAATVAAESPAIH